MFYGWQEKLIGKALCNLNIPDGMPVDKAGNDGTARLQMPNEMQMNGAPQPGCHEKLKLTNK